MSPPWPGRSWLKTHAVTQRHIAMGNHQFEFRQGRPLVRWGTEAQGCLFPCLDYNYFFRKEVDFVCMAAESDLCI